jgi:hypothetical protein
LLPFGVYSFSLSVTGLKRAGRPPQSDFFGVATSCSRMALAESGLTSINDREFDQIFGEWTSARRSYLQERLRSVFAFRRCTKSAQEFLSVLKVAEFEVFFDHSLYQGYDFRRAKKSGKMTGLQPQLTPSPHTLEKSAAPLQIVSHS